MTNDERNPSLPSVLFMTHRVPYPPDRGDRIRSFHELKWLAARARVDLAFPCEQRPAAETMHALGSLCRRVAAAPLGRPMRWLRAAGAIARGRTMTEGLFRSRALRDTLDRWTQETCFDAVLACCSSMAQYLDLPGLEGVPAVVDLVDVDSQKWLDYAAISTGLPRRLFAMEGRRLRRLEASLSGRTAAIVLASGREAELCREFCPADRVHAVPNGVDLEYYRPTDKLPAEWPPRCVFVGALDYRANLDGVSWFCTEVWPAILRRRPAAQFTLVGSRPGAVARRLASRPGVRLAADVPDVRPYLADAAVAIVPLRVARGIQNKLIEAMAMGKAVVATPQALAGLETEPGIHVCQAATPQEWTDAILHLFSDADLRRRIGAAGRRYVEEHHRWDVVLEPLGPLLGITAEV
jgi:sugar transferase (PEP-CTERM/EpsH1 system associated)